MNIDHILHTMNARGVSFLLIGGVNFLLRHAPVLTFDVDIWIEDTEDNRRCCERALAELDAAWGATDADWGPVAERQPGWLDRQGVFCLNSPHGAIDIFRAVEGLSSWRQSRDQAIEEQTAGEVSYWGISDEDMLRCQYALDESQRNSERIKTLEAAVGKRNDR